MLALFYAVCMYLKAMNVLRISAFVSWGVLLFVLQKKGQENEVEGVVVVAEGGEQGVTVQKITEVVRALFDVDSHKIKVIDSK